MRAQTRIIALKAVERCATLLALSEVELARVLDMSIEQAAQLYRQQFDADSMTEEQGRRIALVIRLWQALINRVDNDGLAKIWMRSNNTSLQGTPIEIASTPDGLERIVAYLEAWP